jgi:dihydrolipoamide dehydrogenase
VGCIPSKALLQSSHHFETASKEFPDHGIRTTGIEVDLEAMLQRKNKVVEDLTKGIEFLFKKNKVTYIQGTAVLAGDGKINVTLLAGGEQQLTATNILIATGSDVAPLPGVEIDEKQIISSTGALSLEKIPSSMIVIGGGVIGLELGSVWRRLGAEVTVVEFLDTLLPGMDLDIRKQMQRTMKKQKMTIKLSSKVTGATKDENGVSLTVESMKKGESETLQADVVLVAIGRIPYTNGLGLEDVGMATDESGFIQVDEEFKTSVEGVYAIGDVIGGAMLAHKAEEEGVAVAELLAGKPGHVNYKAIPGVVYTWPEVASVGRSEDGLKRDGISYTVGKFPFSANSRARASGDSEGFVKILADAETDKVLGVHMVGPSAGELIAEAVSVMEFGGSAEDIARTCHAHPCLSEAVKEAALDVDGRAIHM